LPAGVDDDFPPDPVLPNTTVDVELVAAPSTVPGTYGLVITASADVPSGTVMVPKDQTLDVWLEVMTPVVVYLPLLMKY
jgi:hypothetical protein